MSETSIWLLQLSDLHFGAQIKYVLRQGIGEGISFAKTRLGCPTRELIVAVTGDLTRDGTDEQFALAYTYLGRSLSFGWDDLITEPVGLNVRPPRLQTIPGNHDHWSGGGFAHSRPYNAKLFPARFRALPWLESIFSPGRAIISRAAR
jgi:3',5'-cyclic AMP phosphodiesterase CpdA